MNIKGIKNIHTVETKWRDFLGKGQENTHITFENGWVLSVLNSTEIAVFDPEGEWKSKSIFSLHFGEERYEQTDSENVVENVSQEVLVIIANIIANLEN
tara:strand:- start:100 stop:396 length:297 start_codon:yes stop_codon:yes gene_type:complete